MTAQDSEISNGVDTALPGATGDDGVQPIIGTVDRWVARKPDDVAGIYGERQFTWREFRERIQRSAAAQVAAGIGPNDRIAFLDKNSIACLETTLAASLTGAANAVINFRLSPAEVAYIINDAKASIVIVGSEFVDVIAASVSYTHLTLPTKRIV